PGKIMEGRRAPGPAATDSGGRGRAGLDRLEPMPARSRQRTGQPRILVRMHRRSPLREIPTPMLVQPSPDDERRPRYGERRRVPGVRREELAMLAGVSAGYYTRLEQGQSLNASAEVLDAIAAALHLTPAEREHLHVLSTTTGDRTRG